MSIKEVLHDNFTGLAGTSVSWLGVITASQEQLEFSLRCASYVTAISVSLFTLYRMFKYSGRK
jgi:hypothetical protein